MAYSGTSINLMNEYVRQLKSRRMLFTKVQFYAGGVLIVYLAGLLSVMAYRGILSLQLGKVEKAIETSEDRITQLKPLEMKYYFIQNKLSLIRDFWDERVDVKSILAHLGSIVPESVTLDSMTYVESTRTIEITSKAKDIFTTINWLNSLEKEINDSYSDKIAVSGLTRNPEGSYTLSITFIVSEGKEKV